LRRGEVGMKIATWNVNSVRAREERLLGFLAREKPDLLCLQELKVPDDSFPHDGIRQAGYQVAAFGQKTYNGVAVLSLDAPELLARGFDDGVEDAQARFIAVRVGGLTIASAYVPNGGEMGSDKWSYKLAWLARLRRWLDAHLKPADPFALCGDLNVAPEARDVCDPTAWEPTVLFHPQAREALAQVAGFGLVDAFRRHRPEPGLYSWWDYRMLAFPKNQGLRIDHVLMTEALASRTTGARIDRDERKGKQVSDHAPVVVELHWP
jgi:exodeoxyribonuclease-3